MDMDDHQTTSQPQSASSQIERRPSGDEHQPKTSTDDEATQQQQKMSKRQAKRQLKLQRMLSQRKEKRKLEKERKKERRRERGPKAEKQPSSSGKQQFYVMNESKVRTRVGVDMGFDQLMDERTVHKVITQLRHCYAANRRSPNPLQFHVVHLSGKAKQIVDQDPCIGKWDAHIWEQPLDSICPAKDVVYLTADSENVLDRLDEDKFYLIGGLLDHNHHKGTCLQKAQQLGFGHARLPIDAYFRMNGRKVLTINQVFEILVRFSQHSDWEKALLDVIPKRKGIEPKDGQGIVAIQEAAAAEEDENELESETNSQLE